MVVTDDESLASLNKQNRLLLDSLFDEIKINNDFKTENNRFIITKKGSDTQPWYNGTRSNAYTDSIYDETILVDADFLFQDANLDKLWGSNMPIVINKDIITIIRIQDYNQCKYLPHQIV